MARRGRGSWQKKDSWEEVAARIAVGIMILMAIALPLKKILAFTTEVIIPVIIIGAIGYVLYVIYRDMGKEKSKVPAPATKGMPVRNKVIKFDQAVTPDNYEGVGSLKSDTENISASPIASEMKLTRDVLYEMDWKLFETLCTEAIKEQGLHAKETSFGADGGVDIVVYSKNSEEPAGIVQCKSGFEREVDVKVVRELAGVMAIKKYKNGMIISSGDFTQPAKAEAGEAGIRLVSGQLLIDAINKMSPEKSKRLADMVYMSDYTTQTCPKCGVKMVKRNEKKERPFWGCPRYPRCVGKISIKQR